MLKLTMKQLRSFAVLCASFFAIAHPVAADTGFAITINGSQIAGDPVVAQQVRRADEALQDADVQITYDGFGTRPRLDLELVGPARAYRPGDVVTVQSALNYPAYISRGEVRVIDMGTTGGPSTLAVIPIQPNGRARIAVPAGENVVVVHRVYDAQGRYDETRAIPLDRPLGASARDGIEGGDSLLARQRIPVFGGAVTVSGANVAPGASVTALGEPVRADASGRFVIQRILPAGDYGVGVRVQGAGQNVSIVRDVEVPASQFFYVGTLDLTYGYRRTEGGARESYDTGRLAFFIEGRTQSGYEITASADSGEGEIRDIFRRLDDRDPRDTFLRVDPRDLYPTYGDDSTLEDRTPTSGNVFLRIEREGNYLQWGDFEAQLDGDTYVRNDRTLYGLSGYGATRSQTSQGEPRAQALVYAAQPDQVPVRDVLLGTGGSLYQLSERDISRGTETLSVQYRDADTGRIISTQRLTAGQDYDINYIQGRVLLRRPLQGSTNEGVVVGSAGDGIDVVLVAQYEYTPDAGDLDGFAYGGRVEGWLTDEIRFGIAGLVEETGSADQTLLGADFLYQVSEDSYLRLEYARSEGPGFGSSFSADGGLVFDPDGVASGTGEAIRLEARAKFADFGLGYLSLPGTVGFYYEGRTEGFATLDTQVTSATGDETFWGISAEVTIREGLEFAAKYDDYSNAVGQFDRIGTLDVSYDLSPTLTVTAGLEYRDILDANENGSRTDVALRLDYQASDVASVYGYVQGTVAMAGLERNDRVGVGAEVTLANGWTLSGEVSGGSTGAGGRLLASYADENGGSRYIGYTLQPGRDISGVDLRGRDAGQIVLGGRQQISDDVSVFGENSYDMFGRYRSLSSAYGVTYAPNDVWTTSIVMDYGRVSDDADNDFDRASISIGMQYATETIEASGRLELRTENGLRSGEQIESDTLLLTSDLSYRIDEDQRLVFSAELARTETEQSTTLDGDYADVRLGYAYRPVEDDRLNVLARYRFLIDEYGQRIEGNDENGPLQRSHVFSVDASYDLDRNWTLGAKLGYRSAETAASEGDAYTRNDAWLAVASARYHMVNNWDALIELRSFNLVQAETSDFGVLAAGYRQINENVSVGVGYNFGSFSDDLNDLVQDDSGMFVNLIAQF